MPKCDRDTDLQNQVKLFMSKHRLTIGGAAAKMGVHRSTLWRFCRDAMAREDTRARYRTALASQDGEFVSDVAVPVAAPTIVQRRATGQKPLDEQELKRIRAACEGVLALLDVYESQSMGNKI